MEAINEVNELLTTKLCSPVIIYGVIVIISLVGIYLCRSNLSRYNTLKMDNLHKLFTMQELKFLIVLGVIMFGLCQYNKTELAWIFLIFPIIYVLIQNSLLYIHVSSGMQNAPQEQKSIGNNYGLGMNPPLLSQSSQGPPAPEITKEPPKVPSVSSSGFEFPKQSNGIGNSMGGGLMSGGLMGGNTAMDGSNWGASTF